VIRVKAAFFHITPPAPADRVGNPLPRRLRGNQPEPYQPAAIGPSPDGSARPPRGLIQWDAST
jgi:hypothetical protein